MHESDWRAAAGAALCHAAQREGAAWARVQTATTQHGYLSPEWQTAMEAWQEALHVRTEVRDVAAWLRHHDPGD
jgi:hypothetical protein